jgi:hypothetical protein
MFRSRNEWGYILSKLKNWKGDIAEELTRSIEDVLDNTTSSDESLYISVTYSEKEFLKKIL